MLASLRTNHIEWVLAKFLLSWKCMWHVWWGIQSVPSDQPAIGGVSLSESVTLTQIASRLNTRRVQVSVRGCWAYRPFYTPLGGQGWGTEDHPWCTFLQSEKRTKILCSINSSLFYNPQSCNGPGLPGHSWTWPSFWSVWDVSTHQVVNTKGILLIDLLSSWASLHWNTLKHNTVLKC